MGVTKKPDLADPVLRAKLAKGMGHNYYGEPAWPNDLLYIFPVCILGTIACCIGVSVGQSTLTRFYSAHTFVLPVVAVVLMLTHFVMIRKQGISGPL